ncbi:heterokaryon incompatibility, partial [Setomelanomma holmii]
INDHPPYIALSYTWGDPNDTVPVLCNGRVIAVTRNLKEALWQFREDRKRLVRSKSSTMSRSRLLHFWIDAICIDQTNNKEKSFQVGMMAEIYQRACHVFAWLGPADKSSDLAIRCINTIGTMAEAYGMEDAQSNLLPITELKDFFTRSWWTRMWVLQEITLS